jgi:hypothetical protein
MSWIRRDFGWVGFLLAFLLGVALLAFTYLMYRDAVWQDEMVKDSPVVCMKILSRTKGLGTVKYPNKIKATYGGKEYHFNVGSKLYRNLAGVDTIAVFFDSSRSRAVLPTTGQVRHYAFLYFMLFVVSMILIVGSILETIKLRKGRRAQVP